MSIITGHWSVSRPVRLHDYHVEFGLKAPIPDDVLSACRKARNALQVPWGNIVPLFNIWKNTNFDTATTYGTWMWNHDFRDSSPNIEVAALCMSDATTNDFGEYPYTKVHAWVHAAIIARIAKLKNLDPLESFVPVNGFINGPLFSVSTHGERAYQTVDSPIDTQNRGYGLYSKDPDCRWDLAVLDAEDAHLLGSFESAYASTKLSAAWLRATASQLLHLNLVVDMWGLDQEVPRVMGSALQSPQSRPPQYRGCCTPRQDAL